ncbi:MAG: hypothetical protein L6V93_22590 [Clostridiales bacterium]|nr:MAG: hypothetical protein L6V93_22590 [Clostridiales bacterium]
MPFSAYVSILFAVFEPSAIASVPFSRSTTFHDGVLRSDVNPSFLSSAACSFG